MNKFLTLIFLLKISSCECDYSGEYSFVKWDKDKQTFLYTTVPIGSVEQSFNIESCDKSGNNLNIVASVYSRNSLKIDKKAEEFYIIGEQKKTKKVDTLYVFTNTLENKYTFDLKKYKYFVFKEKGSTIGNIFFTKGFKKYRK